MKALPARSSRLVLQIFLLGRPHSAGRPLGARYGTAAAVAHNLGRNSLLAADGPRHGPVTGGRPIPDRAVLLKRRVGGLNWAGGLVEVFTFGRRGSRTAGRGSLKGPTNFRIYLIHGNVPILYWYNFYIK